VGKPYVEIVAWLNAKQKWGWEHDPRVGGWIKWQFWFQWKELQKGGGRHSCELLLSIATST
jgi:hypothetical protein